MRNIWLTSLVKLASSPDSSVNLFYVLNSLMAFKIRIKIFMFVNYILLVL